MTTLTIKCNHPVRKAIAEVATYFDCKGDMLRSIESVCNDHNMQLGLYSCEGDSGWTVIPIHPVGDDHTSCDCGAGQEAWLEFNNRIALSWYTLSSGRVECTVYVS